MKLGSYILCIVYFEEIIFFSNVFDEKCMKAVCKRKRSKLLSRFKLMSPTVYWKLLNHPGPGGLHR